MRAFSVKFTVVGEGKYHTFTFSEKGESALDALAEAKAKLQGNHVLIGTTITKVLVQPIDQDKEVK
jgi:flavodoxin